MADTNYGTGSDDANGGGVPQGAVASRSRRAAEWTTLTLSIAIVAALAGYLLYHAIHENAPYVPVQARARVDLTGREGGWYILPVEIKNPGRHTLKELEATLTFRGPGGSREERAFKLDYLGEGATQTRYFYFDRHPSDLDIRIRPLAYALE